MQETTQRIIQLLGLCCRVSWSRNARTRRHSKCYKTKLIARLVLQQKGKIGKVWQISIGKVWEKSQCRFYFNGMTLRWFPSFALHIPTANDFCITAPFSSPEAALLLVSTKNRDLWPSPTTFRFLNGFVNTIDWDQNKSDLSNLTLNLRRVTGSPWITDFRSCAVKPEVLNSWSLEFDYSRAPCLGADQKERGLWGRECISARTWARTRTKHKGFPSNLAR